MPAELVNVSIRLSREDIDRLEALAARFGGVVPKTTLARAALLLGLARVEAEGLSALEPGKAPAPKAKRRT